MQKIGTSIFDFGVYLGYFKSRFISVTRAFGFPTHFLLRYFQLLIQPIKMLWIDYFLPIASTQQTRDAYINSHFFIGWWQVLNGRVIYQQINKPSTRRFEFNCNSRRTAPRRQKPRPNNIQWFWFFAFSKPESIVLIFKSRLGKLSRATVSFSFKPWVLSSFTPEISKSFLQMSQTLHERIRVLVASRRWRVSAVRYRANFVEKVQIFGFLPASQKARGLTVVDSFLSFIPSFGFSRKSLVVDQAHATHCPSQEIFLLGSWVKTVFVSTLSHAYIIQH